MTWSCGRSDPATEWLVGWAGLEPASWRLFCAAPPALSIELSPRKYLTGLTWAG